MSVQIESFLHKAFHLKQHLPWKRDIILRHGWAILRRGRGGEGWRREDVHGEPEEWTRRLV